MSAFVLKVISIFVMFACHLFSHAFEFSPMVFFISRIGFIFYAFMITEGIKYTSNRVRYAGKLLFLALLSEIPYDLMICHVPFFPGKSNVVFTLLIGVLVIWLCEFITSFPEMKQLKWLVVFFVTIIGTIITAIINSDYCLAGVPLIVMFYFWNRNSKYRVPWLFCIITVFTALCMYSYMPEYGSEGFLKCFIENNTWMYLGSYLSIPFLLKYNGKKGYSAPWFRWLYWMWYPLHALLVYLISSVI